MYLLHKTKHGISQKQKTKNTSKNTPISSKYVSIMIMIIHIILSIHHHHHKIHTNKHRPIIHSFICNNWLVEKQNKTKQKLHTWLKQPKIYHKLTFFFVHSLFFYCISWWHNILMWLHSIYSTKQNRKNHFKLNEWLLICWSFSFQNLLFFPHIYFFLPNYEFHSINYKKKIFWQHPSIF